MVSEIESTCHSHVPLTLATHTSHSHLPLILIAAPGGDVIADAPTGATVPHTAAHTHTTYHPTYHLHPHHLLPPTKLIAELTTEPPTELTTELTTGGECDSIGTRMQFYIHSQPVLELRYEEQGMDEPQPKQRKKNESYTNHQRIFTEATKGAVLAAVQQYKDDHRGEGPVLGWTNPTPYIAKRPPHATTKLMKCRAAYSFKCTAKMKTKIYKSDDGRWVAEVGIANQHGHSDESEVLHKISQMPRRTKATVMSMRENARLTPSMICRVLRPAQQRGEISQDKIYNVIRNQGRSQASNLDKAGYPAGSVATLNEVLSSLTASSLQNSLPAAAAAGKLYPGIVMSITGCNTTEGTGTYEDAVTHCHQNGSIAGFTFSTAGMRGGVPAGDVRAWFKQADFNLDHNAGWASYIKATPSTSTRTKANMQAHGHPLGALCTEHRTCHMPPEVPDCHCRLPNEAGYCAAYVCADLPAGYDSSDEDDDMPLGSGDFPPRTNASGGSGCKSPEREY